VPYAHPLAQQLVNQAALQKNTTNEMVLYQKLSNQMAQPTSQPASVNQPMAAGSPQPTSAAQSMASALPQSAPNVN